ncbi:Cytochrome P450 9e2 [Ooceraea biroi]|uniref:Cytochrome P450 9e2 n=1 Tax=Ooceraea biroi TaxID=2015173 RepID=A0A026WP94_OOCBI|nr:Cytochrome P450 9e2 [Ooceraea biroi]
MEYWTMPLAIAIVILSIYYFFNFWNSNFFKKHGVMHVPPVPIFGNITPIMFRRKAFPDYMITLYNKFADAKYFGCYATTTPVFVLRDPEIIKSVLIKNFDSFPDHIFHVCYFIIIIFQSVIQRSRDCELFCGYLNLKFIFFHRKNCLPE